MKRSELIRQYQTEYKNLRWQLTEATKQGNEEVSNELRIKIDALNEFLLDLYKLNDLT